MKVLVSCGQTPPTAYSLLHACFSRRNGVRLRLSSTSALIGGQAATTAHWASPAGGAGMPQALVPSLPPPHQGAPLPRPKEWVQCWGVAPPDPEVKPRYQSLGRAGR